MTDWNWIVGLYLFVGGMLFAAVVLNWRVDACEAASASGRCVINISFDGINLLPTHLSSQGEKE